MAVKDHMINYKRISIQFFKMKQPSAKDGQNVSVETREEVMVSGKQNSNFPQSLEFIENATKRSKGSYIPSKFSVSKYKASDRDNFDDKYKAGNKEDIVPTLSAPTVRQKNQRRHKDFYTSIRKMNHHRAVAMANHSNLRLNYSSKPLASLL